MLSENKLRSVCPGISSDLIKTSWQALENAIIYYRDRPLGTVAARSQEIETLNYDQCFTRDFAIPARSFQTWTIAGFLVAYYLLSNAENTQLFSHAEDSVVIPCS